MQLVEVGVGRTVLDDYLLLRQIGRGGVSLVFEAIDLARMRRAAVKVLAPAFAHSQRAVHGARQEPLLMREMRHPAVPKVFASGDVLASGQVVPCYAMELLNGASLATRLEDGPLPWREAVEIAAFIAELLAIAHRRGVAHRDLTPDNVMVTSTGAKLIDFGLATTFRPADEPPPVGPTWPALRRREPVRLAQLPSDPRLREQAQAWDVYALGVMLYQMLSGRSPHPPGARLLRPAPTPVLLAPGVPRSLAELCRQCMAKRPTDRPGSRTVALSLWAEFATTWDN